MSDSSLEHWNTDPRSVHLIQKTTTKQQRIGLFLLCFYLDDDLQGFDLLVRGPGLLQGLVELLDAVGIILLREVQQLPLGTLRSKQTPNPQTSPPKEFSSFIKLMLEGRVQTSAPPPNRPAPPSECELSLKRPMIPGLELFLEDRYHQYFH